ncbi:hypothetical protein J6590_087280 [Homalodisca vitripennis]|nr:hypothetical protein J6590_087280 [Homalodisca vitripennis]
MLVRIGVISEVSIVGNIGMNGYLQTRNAHRLPPHEIPLPYLQLQCNRLATCPTTARFHLRLHFMDGNRTTYLQC